jgi:DNA-binding SARP family transcriptional activator
VIPPRAPAAAPLRLSLLGEAGLEAGDDDVTRVLAQPRRFALLVRLAVGVPGALLRRDHLLAMFWPESEASQARASLRQALRYLRVGLGSGVIVGRGDDEVGVDPSRLSCDVAAFDQALDEGRDDAAVALYRGPLLPGFQVSDAPEFERWLSAERRRLRAAAVDAAVRLAGAAEEHAEPDRARALLRRAVEIDPVNEAVARRRIDLLDRLGDRGSALAGYQELARRLKEELDVGPAPETLALVERIRGGPLSEGAAGRGGGRRPERRRVVVTHFRNETGRAELDLVEAMAADWITQGLTALRDITVVPPVPGDDTDEVSGRTGAGTVIRGAVYPEGERIRLSAQIVDVIEDRLFAAPDDALCPADDPAPGVEALSRSVNAALAPVLSPRAVHVRSTGKPPSLEAYRAYMEGLEQFIRGRWRPALDHFRSALEAAPDYALPRVVQAIVHWNLEEFPEAEAVARQAASMRNRLGPFEAAVLDMVRSWLVGDWLGALEAVRIQAGLAPGSLPHAQVAEEARRLNRPEEARDVLLRLDPEAGELTGWIFFWIELATAQHLLGDHEGELRSARRARALHPDDPVAALLEVRALSALGDVDPLERVLDAAAALPAGTPAGGRGPRPGDLLREAGLELAAHGHGDVADPFLARSASWYEERVTDGAPESLRRDLARSLYHAGRHDEAEAAFRALAGSGAPAVSPVGFHHRYLQGHMDHGYLALLAARRGDDDEVAVLRRSLGEASGPFLFGTHWYWLACLDAVTGDHDRAAARLRRALAEGLPHEMFLHADPHLHDLRGHARYEAMMRPRG